MTLPLRNDEPVEPEEPPPYVPSSALLDAVADAIVEFIQNGETGDEEPPPDEA